MEPVTLIIFGGVVVLIAVLWMIGNKRQRERQESAQARRQESEAAKAAPGLCEVAGRAAAVKSDSGDCCGGVDKAQSSG